MRPELTRMAGLLQTRSGRGAEGAVLILALRMERRLFYDKWKAYLCMFVPLETV